jgi:hypothetical protein
MTLLEPTLLSLPQEGIEAAFTVDWERDRRWEIVGERERDRWRGRGILPDLMERWQ